MTDGDTKHYEMVRVVSCTRDTVTVEPLSRSVGEPGPTPALAVVVLRAGDTFLRDKLNGPMRCFGPFSSDAAAFEFKAEVMTQMEHVVAQVVELRPADVEGVKKFFGEPYETSRS